MITKLAKDDVIALGARNKASYLLLQYGYTLGIARLDGDDLVKHLTPTYLDEVDECAERLRESHKNRVVAEEEAKGSTQHVNEVMSRAKVWPRGKPPPSPRARMPLRRPWLRGLDRSPVAVSTPSWLQPSTGLLPPGAAIT